MSSSHIHKTSTQTEDQWLINTAIVAWLVSISNNNKTSTSIKDKLFISTVILACQWTRYQCWAFTKPHPFIKCVYHLVILHWYQVVEGSFQWLFNDNVFIRDIFIGDLMRCWCLVDKKFMKYWYFIDFYEKRWCLVNFLLRSPLRHEHQVLHREQTATPPCLAKKGGIDIARRAPVDNKKRVEWRLSISIRVHENDKGFSHQ